MWSRKWIESPVYTIVCLFRLKSTYMFRRVYKRIDFFRNRVFEVTWMLKMLRWQLAYETEVYCLNSHTEENTNIRLCWLSPSSSTKTNIYRSKIINASMQECHALLQSMFRLCTFISIKFAIQIQYFCT